MTHRVRFTRAAEADLLELYDFLARADVAAAARALTALRKGFGLLEAFPFSCRKADGAGGNPLVRELVVTFGHAGFVALFEIDSAETVTVLAVRHQREDDFH